MLRPTVDIRVATAADGREVEELVRRCGTLDTNSAYAYVMFCDLFGDTCVVARGDDGRLVGFVTGFVPPRDPTRLFLWQVGVDPRCRGRGLARTLVREFVASARTERTTHLVTTVSPDNRASLALFESFARALGSRLERAGEYPAAWLGDGHAVEHRYEIPLDPLET